MAPGEPRIFRIENQATVAFLQRISETGHLTRVRVSPLSSATPSAPIDLQASRYSASLTIAAVALSAGMEDWWALSAIGALILARLLNIFVLKRRVLWDQKDTKDAKDVGGDDIIVLLSQDRWVRMQGAVRDLTAVTAGPWLRDMNAAECCAVNFATVLTHVSVVLAFNGSPTGSMLLAGMLVLSLGLVGRANATARHLRMFSCVLGQEGPAKGYVRRKDMAEELIAEHGNEEGWAVRLGLVLGKRKGSTADQTFQSSLAPAYVEL
ncbi:uncharacterized protein PHACADRAFT_253496 [Phanerochaete carnosa HHB-10118-sp]|uniref:Uncharacterized protein n=1 Tax=Phanerochaete carnosa (strain HHB-10118-sp) TaxID=650164 RepID=K5WBQ7_PHACS|nr:uncharacterized protein PHACADRAFT_253496 [Phanerochaete carnosa HHB-10118-sp]EKM56404.1 hypothetical protein PHACADRAFT_253496 [Phanerochaete carnosa HHB-10118-sp]